MEINKNVPKVKDGVQVDRIILGKSESKLLAKWVEDFNGKADGLVKVSKADLVNYLIAAHNASMSSEEVREIAARYYDETRWLGWSVVKMKAAKKKGVSLLFEDLMKFRDELLGKALAFGKKKKIVPTVAGSSEMQDVKSTSECHEAQKASAEDSNNKEL